MAKLLTILCGVIIFVGIAGIYRLPPGWFTPSFQVALTDTVGPVELSIPEAQMRWGGWRNPLGIKVRQVTIKKIKKDLKIEIPSLLFSLKFLPLLVGRAEIGKCSFETAKVSLKNHVIGIISVKAKIRRKMISLRADFNQVNATALFHVVGEQTFPQASSFLFSGKLILEGGAITGLKKLDLQCNSSGGLFSIPSIYPVPLRLDGARLNLVGSGQTLSLQQVFLKHGEAQLSVKGTLHSSVSWKDLYDRGGKLSLALEGTGGSIAIDDLNLLWPHGLSPKPRHWVVNNLSKGMADHLTTQMQGIIEVEPAIKIARFDVPQIEGQIHASGITVNYFGKLPPVVNTKGICSFSRQQFKIDAVGMANGLQLKSAKIVINDIHVDDQTIDIDLDLEGPVRNSLEIINADPLLLAKKLDLDPRRISGQSSTRVHLAFPLEEDVPLELVHVSAVSQIKEGKIIFETKIKEKPIQLDKGVFTVTASRKALEMKGNATLQDVSTKIHWQEYFEDRNIPFRRQFILGGVLDLEKLVNFGFNASDYLAGKSPTQIKYTVGRNNVCLLEGHFDLKSAIMVSPILYWQKEQGKAAQFNVKMRSMGKNDPFFIEAASLVAPSLRLDVLGSSSAKGDHLEVKHCQLGDSHLEASILRDRGGLVHATVRGKILDISHILDDSIPEPLLRPQEEQDIHNEPQVKLKLILDKVRFGTNNDIHKVTGNMVYHGNTLYEANLFGEAPHNKERITLTVNPLSQNRQQFTLHSGDGGHLLEMLGADYELEGGQLTIRGIKTNESPKPQKNQPNGKPNNWQVAGEISIDDFTINKAPLLARLLSAASLQGIVNFFSGRGIHFQTGTADFSLTEANLTVKKARLISPSLGLLLEGAIDRQKHIVNFSGELIPLYIINTVLARVPLLGTLVSGGKDDGIFMTQFTLTGDRKDPSLAINPITSVTPGLVREIFSPQKVQAPEESTLDQATRNPTSQ